MIKNVRCALPALALTVVPLVAPAAAAPAGAQPAGQLRAAVVSPRLPKKRKSWKA
ncbi:hypothetical protein ABZ642_44690 [Streptomyces sp. NPDC007157]|uniref:hypothetical protein n=1 Tax=Streptomyces sp. NPDC007157 TaxID=3154681 RepID=UPI0033C69B39